MSDTVVHGQSQERYAHLVDPGARLLKTFKYDMCNSKCRTYGKNMHII